MCLLVYIDFGNFNNSTHVQNINGINYLPSGSLIASLVVFLSAVYL